MADTPVSPTPIDDLPDYPQRATDTPAQFSTKADATVAAYPGFVTETNAVGTNVYNNAVSAFDSASEALVSATNASNSESVAAGSANFEGDWDDLTGALNVPASVRHDNRLWLLLNDLADVTASEPGVTADWATFGQMVTETRTSNTQFDVADLGKIVTYTTGGFNQTIADAANLKASWYLYVRTTAADPVTLVPFGSQTIDGQPNKVIKHDCTTLLMTDGSNLTTIEFEAPAADNHVIVNTGNGHGSTNDKIRRYTNIQSSAGDAITYADSAADGASFTIEQSGMYTISMTDVKKSGTGQIGASLNSNQLTTALSLITANDRLMFTFSAFASPDGIPTTVTNSVRLERGDVVRPHTSGSNDGNNAYESWFSIRKIGA